MVDRYLETAAPETSTDSAPADVVGLLTPHAGLMYSGPVAAYAFRAVFGREIEVVAIVCPSHFHDDGPVLTSACAAYQTPLGEVPVDHAAASQLRMALASALALRPEAALFALRGDDEHAIEIELPFLQRTLAPSFLLLPIMIRDQSLPVVNALGQALAQVLAGRRALVIASSDLSHDQSQAEALTLDRAMLAQVEAFDPLGVLMAQADGRGSACGYGAIATVLWAARALGATRARVLRHATSGDVSGHYETVVGYGAAVLLR